MLKRIGYFFADQVSKILPDSFVFAILLTFISMILAIAVAGAGITDLLEAWVKGLFSSDIVTFAFLMIMVLTFGFCIGVSPPAKWLFNRIVKWVRKPWQVYLSIALFSSLMMLVNWGLAPVTALFAMEICKRVKGVDFRLACAALYSGMLVWHGGLSASAPMMMATEATAAGFIEQGLIDRVVPIQESLLLPLNLILIAACLVVLPVIILLLKPKVASKKFDAALLYEKRHGGAVTAPETPAESDLEHRGSPADLLNRSPVVSIFLFLLCSAGALGIARSKGFNLGALALLMLAGGLLLQWRPINYVTAMKEAIKGSADIVLQFPLFGGIMSIFTATGLAVIMANGLVGLATSQTLPFFAFVSAAIVNLFIPSGGGEWLVLATPLLTAAKAVGASMGKTVVAFAFGDALTNLINPFWTLTFLPIMGHLVNIRPRDFMGFTVLICLIFFVIESAIILLV